MAAKKEHTKKKSSKLFSKITLSQQTKTLLGSALMIIGVAFFLAFISYFFTWKEDQSILSELSNRQENAQNLLGKIGASLGDLFVYNGVGLAAFVFAYLLFVTGLHLFVASGKPLLNKWVWGVLVALWIAILFGFFTQSSLVLSGVVGV